MDDLLINFNADPRQPDPGAAGGVRYYVEAPDNGPEWGLRSTFTLLYPRKPQ